MKHEREWYTCDRCGKEMTFYNEKYAHFKTEELEPLHKKTIYTAEEKIMIKSNGETAQVFIDGKKVNCTDMELHFIGHANQSPMIKVNARWHKTDENGNTILNEDKTAILTEGIKINC